MQAKASSEWQLRQFQQDCPKKVKRISDSQSANTADDSKRLWKIIKKYRIQQYVNTFKSKIQRTNIYRTPVCFQLKVDQQSQNSFLHIQGVEIKSKTFESFIFAGDIIFSLIVFYIAVFQAFIQSFRNQQSSAPSIILIKVMAICFQFSKLFIKSIKKDIVNGKALKFIDQIIWQSTGLLDLLLYSAAIAVIILSMIYRLDYNISVAAFLIAAIKLFKIPINLQVLDMHYINSNRKQMYWNLVKVIIFEVVFMHFIAGLLLAMSAFDNEKNWLIVHGLDDQSWGAQYSWALYWSATLVTTTGFGDFIAANKQEALLVAALELFSSVILAYNLNVIGTIVLSLRNTDQDLQNKLATFRRMANESPVSPLIEQKIFSYISYEKEIQEKFEFEERATFLNELPEQLKAEYKSDVNQTIFRQLPFFCNLRLQTLNNLAMLFSNKVCYPGQNLIPCKEQSQSILILRRGRVNFQYQRLGANIMNGIAIQTFKSEESYKPKPILLNNTFINRNRIINYDVIAREYSLIMTLPQIDFMEAIRTSDIQKEHFFTIYDKHDTFIFGANECQYCPQEYHNKFQCPKIHFVPFNFQIINKHLLENSHFKQTRFRNFKKNGRKQHCYYLRRNYYQPYENYKNINPKANINPNIMNRINRMKTFVEELNHQELLASFEQTFRKIISENQVDTNQSFQGIDVDVIHDYLSYFSEGNAKELIGRKIKRKSRFQRTNIDHRLTLLAASSKKLLYRQGEEEKKKKVDSILKDSLMIQFY